MRAIRGGRTACSSAIARILCSWHDETKDEAWSRRTPGGFTAVAAERPGTSPETVLRGTWRSGPSRSMPRPSSANGRYDAARSGKRAASLTAIARARGDAIRGGVVGGRSGRGSRWRRVADGRVVVGLVDLLTRLASTQKEVEASARLSW